MGERILVVGMKLTPECRENLTWIVAKLTQPGDHVVAVHVAHPSKAAFPAGKELDPVTKQELDNTFEGVLSVYQSLCNLKQIKLDIKVVIGASVKEALVDTAKLEDATKLIIGTSKFLPTGFSTSLAKFCLKRLPCSCSITIIDRGRVVFDKTGRQKSTDDKKFVVNCTASVIQRGIEKLYCSSQHRVTGGKMSNDENSSPPSSSASEINFSESEKSFPDSPVSVLDSSGADADKGYPLKVFKIGQRSENEAPASTSCLQEDGFPKPGWPLRAFALEKVTASSRCLARNLSVVNWAMQLPDRRPATRASSSSGRASIWEHATDSELVKIREKMLVKSKSTSEKHERFRDWRCIRTIASAASQISQGSEEQAGTLAEKLQLLCSKDMICYRRFTVEELNMATSNISKENIIGRGGCSIVYKGILSNGQTVAVKCLNEVTSEKQELELLTEVEILSTLRHKNVIHLLGYCVGDKKRMLVYSFAKNGNLEQRLHGELSRHVLDWPARWKIALGSSEALQYLHSGCPKPVVHRDVKSSNILLSSDYEPQVSDFGLAKWAPSSAPHITCSDVMGTFGYLAPEYFMFGKVNEKTDVYSFGVVLLELITGRHPIDASKPKGQENLVIWGRPLLEAGDVEQLADPRLKGDYKATQMKRMVLAAALCLRQSPQLRPSMKKVLELLSDEEEELWAAQELRQSKQLDEEYFKDELYATSSSDGADVRSHLALAMVGVEDDKQQE